MRPVFHLFAYGTLPPKGRHAGPPWTGEGALAGCTRIDEATVQGTLYDIDGHYPALVLAGTAAVHGEIWRCPVERLAELDNCQAVATGLFRRVGVRVSEVACWTYVAGPRLTRELVPDRRIAAGRWTGTGLA